MSGEFIVWDNEQDALTSLSNLHTLIGCPVGGGGVYELTIWDTCTKSVISDNWGWYKPNGGTGLSDGQIVSLLVGNYTIYPERPLGWVTEE